MKSCVKTTKTLSPGCRSIISHEVRHFMSSELAWLAGVDLCVDLECFGRYDIKGV